MYINNGHTFKKEISAVVISFQIMYINNGLSLTH